MSERMVSVRMVGKGLEDGDGLLEGCVHITVVIPLNLMCAASYPHSCKRARSHSHCASSRPSRTLVNVSDCLSLLRLSERSGQSHIS